MACDGHRRPVAEFMREYIIVRDSLGSYGHFVLNCLFFFSFLYLAVRV